MEARNEGIRNVTANLPFKIKPNNPQQKKSNIPALLMAIALRV